MSSEELSRMYMVGADMIQRQAVQLYEELHSSGEPETDIERVIALIKYHRMVFNAELKAIEDSCREFLETKHC